MCAFPAACLAQVQLILNVDSLSRSTGRRWWTDNGVALYTKQTPDVPVSKEHPSHSSHFVWCVQKRMTSHFIWSHVFHVCLERFNYSGLNHVYSYDSILHTFNSKSVLQTCNSVCLGLALINERQRQSEWGLTLLWVVLHQRLPSECHLRVISKCSWTIYICRTFENIKNACRSDSNTIQQQFRCKTL